MGDAYWSPELSEGWDRPVALDLSEIRSEQENIVIRYLADGLSPVQRETLGALVADGGEVAPADVAESTDRHVESVRRALRDMEDLVHREYSRVELRSSLIAEQVHQAIEDARESTERALRTSAKAIQAAERGLDETASVFVAWADHHGIDVDGVRDARMRLRATENPRDPDERARARGRLRQGLEAWLEAGFPRGDYLEAVLEWGDGSVQPVGNLLA